MTWVQYGSGNVGLLTGANWLHGRSFCSAVESRCGLGRRPLFLLLRQLPAVAAGPAIKPVLAHPPVCLLVSSQGPGREVGGRRKDKLSRRSK